MILYYIILNYIYYFILYYIKLNNIKKKYIYIYIHVEMNTKTKPSDVRWFWRSTQHPPQIFIIGVILP